MKNNQELAEFLGILLGDGNLNKKSNCITIVGSLEDYHYYKHYVIPLIDSLFDVNVKLRKRNDRNAYYVDFTSKEVMEYLTKEIGLIRGNKVNAKVPNLIKNNMELMPHFLRGLIDTDGCLKFSKQTKIKHYYPRLDLWFRVSPFADDIGKLLHALKFRFGSWKDNRFNGIKCYQISGAKNLELWNEKVGFSNPVRTTKYLFWKKFGYYIPRSSLTSRLQALNLNIEDLFVNSTAP